MKLLKNGRPLCLALALSFSGCRTSKPPVIEICIGDGAGGANCVESDGSRKYRLPSEMKNYWATNQPDQARFAAWCYDTNEANIETVMASIKKNATEPGI